ncbi:MAG: hypothetical protein IPM35_02455 [Myxococcales bacterium]|nr:hypothetical protein [Myxococcales bacterium]
MSLIDNDDDLTVGAHFARGDHVEIGEHLIHRLREDGEVVYADGELHRYDAERGIYAAVPRHTQSCIIQSFAGMSVASGGDKPPRPLKVKKPDVDGPMRCAWDLVAQPEFFANAPKGMVFSNIFVEVTAHGIATLPNGPQNRAKFGYPFEYAPKAVPEQFLRFLASVFHGDPEMPEKSELLLEYGGASLLGFVTMFQRAVVCKGEGANGKSVLLKILEAAMPTGSTCAVPPQTWDHEYRVAMLASKRLNLLSELPEADILASEKFKGIVSGDPTTGRSPYKEPFTIYPVAGHIFAANKLPAVNDQTHGFWRRLLVVEFPRIFRDDEQIKDLESIIIAAELPLIVSCLIQAGQRALARGNLTVPVSSQRAVLEWRMNADQVTAYVAERCRGLQPGEPDDCGTYAKALYNDFRAWSSRNGHRPVASNTFGTRLRSLGLVPISKTKGALYRLRVVLDAEDLEEQRKWQEKVDGWVAASERARRRK